jgi:hypothetical protein
MSLSIMLALSVSKCTTENMTIWVAILTPVSAAYIRRRRSGLLLPQDANDLFLAEP